MGQKEEQKLKALQGKWWYRFAKVIFAVAVLLGLFAALGFALDEAFPYSYEELDEENTTIVCENGNQKIYSFKEANSFEDIYITEYDLSTYKKADGSTDDRFPLEAAEKLCELEGTRLLWTDCPNTFSIGTCDPDEIVPMPEYSINKTYKEVQNGTFGGFILVLLGSIITVFILEELIRRIFYYIVLGKFFPKRDWF